MMMMKRHFTLIVMTCMYIIDDVTGFGQATFTSNSDACNNMNPTGHGVSAQSSSAPFAIEVQPSTYTAGQTLTVTLKSTDGGNFKGFLLQARTVPGNAKVGDFTSILPSGTKANCASQGGKTVTHTSSSQKSGPLEFTWTAPSPGVGSINFVATVVRARITYWRNVKSPVITQASGPTATVPTPTPTPTPAPTDAIEIDLTSCGSTKGCYRQPQDCTTDCTMILTWQKNTDDTVTFEMETTVPFHSYYMAVGLSNDDRMEDDSVMECLHSTAYTGVQMSYNGRHVNNVLDDKTRGLVTADSKVYYTNNILRCIFTRHVIAPVDTSGASSGSSPQMAALVAEQVFPLDKAYTIFLAKGVVDTGNKIQHASYLIIPQPVTLTSDVVNIGGTTGYPLVKAHGILMVLAWMVSASVAILLPRFHRDTFGGKKCCGKDIWFQLHQPLMGIACICTIAGFVIIFVSVGGYVDFPSYPDKAHPPLGIVVTILVILNPLMALCRCNPGTPKRPIFNWLHLIVGKAAHICSIAAIFISTELGKSGFYSWSKWVVVAFIVWHLFIEIILYIHNCCANKKTSEEKYEMRSSSDTAVRENVNTNKPGSAFKKVVIIFHALGVIACAILLIIPIAQA